MGDDAKESAGRARSPIALRKVPPATVEESKARAEGMARALKVGAAPYRDGDGQARYVFFKEANWAAVEPWRRDPRAKRGYRRAQEVRKAAGQLIGQPGDMIEIAKRLGVLHWEQGSDIDGAAARGLHDAIWSREHVYDTFTVPRRYGLDLMETGRIAAVAEEEARRLQAEDPKARGGFWVRDRKNYGLIYVVPNPDPEEPHADADFEPTPAVGDDVVSGGGGEDVVLGQTDTDADNHTNLAETADIQPAPDADSTAKQEEVPVLHYPDVPLPHLEPSWRVPADAETDGDELPVVNMEADRIRNIIANEPGLFEIADSRRARPESPWYENYRFGFTAVWIYQDLIEYEAERQGVGPDLVKAIMYFENARGASYGQPFEAVDKVIDFIMPDEVERKPLSKSILPMNIRPQTWGRLVPQGENFTNAYVNVKAGITMIRRIIERLENPTVAKVGSIYGFTGRETVSDNGARIAHFYETRAWERKPEIWSRELEMVLQDKRRAARALIPSSVP